MDEMTRLRWLFILANICHGGTLLYFGLIYGLEALLILSLLMIISISLMYFTGRFDHARYINSKQENLEG